MKEAIDIASLPEDIQAQIRESMKPKAPLFPIAPREHNGRGFQTKEVVELSEKVDLLIEGFNILWEKKEAK